MNSKQLLSNYGLKWNPFDKPPVDGIVNSPEIDSFCWRVENLVIDGGFAMISGQAGTGKSTVLRLLRHRLTALSDVQLSELERPQSLLSDFYRELAEKFAVDFKLSNRWGSYKQLRERWRSHIESTLFRPIILIDEAQEVPNLVLNELRLMSSVSLDSRSIITVILSGDERLPDKFRNTELVPLGSRIRTRINQEPKTRQELSRILSEAISKAGNPNLITKGLIATLADNGIGNIRAMMNLAFELLLEAIQRELPQIDEKLFLEYTANLQQAKTKERPKK